MERDRVEKRGTMVQQSNKNERRSYDACFKVAVAKYAITTNNCLAARRFDVTEANVRRWRKDLPRLQNCNKTRRAFRGPTKGRHDELEQIVVKFVQEKRNEGVPISREVIRLKANEVARQMNIPQQTFRASLGWVKRMMKRQGFSLRRRTTLAQRLPADFEDKLLSFQRYIIKLRHAHNYLMSQIGNCDQTPVFFYMPSNTTVNTKGEKTVMIRTTGCEKLRVTVMLACLADGSKLPPYVILKRKTMPKEALPKGVFVRVQENGWMTEELMNDWMKVVWNRRPGAALAKRGMLVLDAFRGHLTDTVKTCASRMKTDLVVIPGGMTGQLQVLDVVVNKPFKDLLKKKYSDWLLAGDHSLTPTGKIKRVSPSTLVQWILVTWQQISKDSIIRGFKKCCISNALDGSEDDFLWTAPDLPGDDPNWERGSEDSSSSDGSSDESNSE